MSCLVTNYLEGEHKRGDKCSPQSDIDSVTACQTEAATSIMGQKIQ